MKLHSEKGKLQIGRLNATGNIDEAVAGGGVPTALLSLYSLPVPKEQPINLNFFVPLGGSPGERCFLMA